MREVKTELTGRKEVAAKDSFRWTTPNLKSFARPVDAYAPKAVDNTLANTLNAINTGVNTFVDVQDGMAKQNKLKAQADFGDGTTPVKAKPNSFFNLGVGYNETWDATEHEYLSATASGQYLKGLKENHYFNESEDPGKARKEYYEQVTGEIFKGASESDAGKAVSGKVMGSAWTNGELQAEEHGFQMGMEKALTFQAGTIKESIINGDWNPLTIRSSFDIKWEDFKDTKLQLSSTGEIYRGSDIISRDMHTRTAINTLFSVGMDALNRVEAAWEDGIDDGDPTVTGATEKVMKLITAMESPGAGGVSWSEVLDSNGQPKFRAEIQAAKNAMLARAKQLEAKQKEETEKNWDTNAADFYIRLDASTNRDDTITLQAELRAGLSKFDPKSVPAMLKAVKSKLDGNDYINRDRDKEAAWKIHILEGTYKKRDIARLLEQKKIDGDTASEWITLAHNVEESNKAKAKAAASGSGTGTNKAYDEYKSILNTTLTRLLTTNEGKFNKPEFTFRFSNIQAEFAERVKLGGENAKLVYDEIRMNNKDLFADADPKAALRPGFTNSHEISQKWQEGYYKQYGARARERFLSDLRAIQMIE